MKRLLFIISVIALVTACGNKTQGSSENTDSTEVVADSTEKVVEKPQIPPLQTDSISKEKSDEKAEVSVCVDWPTDGDSALVAAVREYICKILEVSKTTDGKVAVKKALQNDYNETAGLWEETYSGMDDENEEGEEDSDEEEDTPKGPSFSHSISIRKVADNDMFVSYMVDVYIYSGGAHGMSSCVGVSFSKATAKRLGYETVFNDKTITTSIKKQTLFNDKVKTRDFNALLKAGFKEYFGSVSGEGKKKLTDVELDDMVDPELSKLPLPGNPPYFTDKGLEFIYQQYEVAAYCYGMPTFCIPYNKILPYLSDEAKALVPEQAK